MFPHHSPIVTIEILTFLLLSPLLTSFMSHNYAFGINCERHFYHDTMPRTNLNAVKSDYISPILDRPVKRVIRANRFFFMSMFYFFDPTPSFFHHDFVIAELFPCASVAPAAYAGPAAIGGRCACLIFWRFCFFTPDMKMR
ncbi:hypothetical protein FOQG_05356 [Fusarium oxysporum f. sp. raphani 54005]|uniref:Secreted protein n=3 Tax=Fusarium oxysporum TaxID=5507 RepID=X0CFM9_FUSOX|nr:hypothetical protein FOVG_10998 [Fusarium oxysporum f. sp. pisi HDV247]EXK93175.1 hypothetical protein FOQG_05356 [Fusarium oxysporum f. sp. raphani 54005]EXL79820.1 hypothetical protein FOPG_06329 [Fusarium oxysporum f. sp. conglutinans race 2 54008]KAI8405548.1 hypothetical protein FOFC_15029 [Fusarium oxysporum]